jgi:hypothetical protein
VKHAKRTSVCSVLSVCSVFSPARLITSFTAAEFTQSWVFSLNRMPAQAANRTFTSGTYFAEVFKLKAGSGIFQPVSAE